jgi:hypothetical protein
VQVRRVRQRGWPLRVRARLRALAWAWVLPTRSEPLAVVSLMTQPPLVPSLAAQARAVCIRGRVRAPAQPRRRLRWAARWLVLAVRQAAAAPTVALHLGLQVVPVVALRRRRQQRPESPNGPTALRCNKETQEPPI